MVKQLFSSRQEEENEKKERERDAVDSREQVQSATCFVAVYFAVNKSQGKSRGCSLNFLE